MNETLVTVVGNVATSVRYYRTAAGVPVASFRLASTERRFDRGQNRWVDGETSFYTVWAWRWLADNVVGSVSRGDPMMVVGRVRVRQWEREGRQHTAVEIDASALGHDLARGTSAFRRVVRARPELLERQLDTAGVADNGQAPEERSGGGEAGPGPGQDGGAGPVGEAEPAESAVCAVAGGR
jgi:single-strand DNA-binding protein